MHKYSEQLLFSFVRKALQRGKQFRRHPQGSSHVWSIHERTKTDYIPPLPPASPAGVGAPSPTTVTPPTIAPPAQDAPGTPPASILPPSHRVPPPYGPSPLPRSSPSSSEPPFELGTHGNDSVKNVAGGTAADDDWEDDEEEEKTTRPRKGRELFLDYFK